MSFLKMENTTRGKLSRWFLSHHSSWHSFRLCFESSAEFCGWMSQFIISVSEKNQGPQMPSDCLGTGEPLGT